MISGILPDLRRGAVLAALCLGLVVFSGGAVAEQKPGDKANSLRAEVGKPCRRRAT